MNRRITSLEAFAFTSDFRPPEAKPAHGDIYLTADELAALLAETRESTAELVRDETLKAEAATLKETSDNLKQTLTAILHLAEHLETAAIDQADRDKALQNIRRIASAILDGQTDLFEKSAASSSLGNHSA